MGEYINIRLSDNVLHDMILLRIGEESISDLILRLLDNYHQGQYCFNYYYEIDRTEKDLHSYYIWIRVSQNERTNDDYYFRYIEINCKLKNMVKVTKKAFYCLAASRNHPDETFDTKISVLISAKLAADAFSSGQQSQELYICSDLCPTLRTDRRKKRFHSYRKILNTLSHFYHRNII